MSAARSAAGRHERQIVVGRRRRLRARRLLGATAIATAATAATTTGARIHRRRRGRTRETEWLVLPDSVVGRSEAVWRSVGASIAPIHPGVLRKAAVDLVSGLSQLALLAMPARLATAVLGITCKVHW